MKEIWRQLMAALAASVLLVVLAAGTPLQLWVSAVLAVGTYAGVYLTIPRCREDHEVEVAPGVTRKDLNDLLELLETHRQAFTRLGMQARGHQLTLKSTADTMALTAGQLQQQLRGDAEKVKQAGPFLAPYLKRGLEVFEQYAQLAAMPRGDSLDRRLAEFDGHLERIAGGLTDFYERCLQKDLMELEVSSETLNYMMDLALPENPSDERNPS
jgi:hypothetical protein